MTEYQVVVVLDVEAPDRVAAARCALGVINGTRGRYTLPDGRVPDTSVQSWWFPEADLKQVDRNDNGAFRLVPDEYVDCPSCQGAGEISICANDGTHGCSHVNDREYPCRACGGDGVALTSQAQDPDWCQTCGLNNNCDRCAA